MALRLLPLLAAVVLIAGCGESTLDSDKAEKVIADQITEQVGEKVTVECPADVTAETGGKFECTAKNEAGESRPVNVTQKDAEGNVDWVLGE